MKDGGKGRKYYRNARCLTTQVVDALAKPGTTSELVPAVLALFAMPASNL
jgi:hypothetical protein